MTNQRSEMRVIYDTDVSEIVWGAFSYRSERERITGVLLLDKAKKKILLRKNVKMQKNSYHYG